MHQFTLRDLTLPCWVVTIGLGSRVRRMQVQDLEGMALEVLLVSVDLLVGLDDRLGVRVAEGKGGERRGVEVNEVRWSAART